MSIELRPLDLGHAPLLAALHAAAEAVDDTGEYYNEADLVEELSNPELELGKDVIGAFDGDNLVGYCSVVARKDEQDRKAYAFGVTAPERRGEGIGTRLVDAMVARAREIQLRQDGRLTVHSSGLATSSEQASLLGGVGFEPDRWSFGMRIALGEVPPAPELAAGYAIRPYVEADSEGWRLAHNRAFLDHPNFTQWDLAEWKQWVTSSRSFRGHLSFFVTPAGEPDSIAAYVQTNEYDAFEQATGRREAYVAKVGTVPEHRGRGLATTLLQYCLAAYQGAGYDEAALDVDSMNPTGALGIYERAGFATERRFVNYALLLGG